MKLWKMLYFLKVVIRMAGPCRIKERMPKTISGRKECHDKEKISWNNNTSRDDLACNGNASGCWHYFCSYDQKCIRHAGIVEQKPERDDRREVSDRCGAN